MTTDITTESLNRKLLSDINDYLLVAGSPLLVRIEYPRRHEEGDGRTVIIGTAQGDVEFSAPCHGAEEVAAFLAPLRAFLSVQDSVLRENMFHRKWVPPVIRSRRARAERAGEA